MKKKHIRTAEQKLAILKETEEHGIIDTIRNHQIYVNTIYEPEI